MKKTSINNIVIAASCMAFIGCGVPKIKERTASTADLPTSYTDKTDSLNSAKVDWKTYFTDPSLRHLIDSALSHNQELNIMLQEINMSANEIRARKGEYLPFVGARVGGGVEKRSEYTTWGATERQVSIREGRENPDPMPDVGATLFANWEIDIWSKLHNAAKEAQLEYLASVEGKNFMVTNLVAEIANLYYELLALDQEKMLVERNLKLQSDALELVKLQKIATRVTELAVKKFEAEVFKTQSMRYKIDQQIVEAENKLNYLVGQYPQHIAREASSLDHINLPTVQEGLPAQLLDNRPDVRKAELLMAAAKLDVKVAKAKFYPSLGISANLGYQAFNPAYLLKTPQSLIYSITGDLIAPLVNKRAIQAEYLNANANQIQTVLRYEQTLLNAYVEVANQLAKIKNIAQINTLQDKQVSTLTESVQISYDLFNSAHADYMEVLMTQRDAIEAKFELIESQKEQFNAAINLYKSLGGGWQ
ncbi:TolC family protein [Sphingobacterium paludis]|uniref:NodT family efflux transporter outer membrane factor (OMF) lipoprotein n=1 Tax=Sphingobacterium paludis TaxID=1476465 RepID=A0A4R7D9K6_9SPHI|nr:efflux transporter outer membrane subunit [Sphingobacterium paludis]TDS17437.1 NodT family efflux transporter outer membrane factor (OMF) lipoprotein [Sphingobacterium paludis]